MTRVQLQRSLEGYASVLRTSTGAIERAGIPHLVLGSIAMRSLGRPRTVSADEDIDLFVRPPDAPSALDSLKEAGFVTVEDDPTWIHKAKRAGVTVDLIFKAAGRVYMDDEMFERGVLTDVLGVEVRLVPAEDLVVMKALLHDEDRAFDWFDALSLLHRDDVDWEYLARRAEAFGAQRVLSLMIFAQARELDVPADVITRLREATRS